MALDIRTLIGVPHRRRCLRRGNAQISSVCPLYTHLCGKQLPFDLVFGHSRVAGAARQPDLSFTVRMRKKILARQYVQALQDFHAALSPLASLLGQSQVRLKIYSALRAPVRTTRVQYLHR